MGGSLQKIMYRTITAKSKKLVDIWHRKQELHKSIREFVTEIERIEKEMNKLGIKMEKERERAVAETKRLQLDLGEFETISEYDISGEDGVAIKVVDRVEEYKTAYRERNANTPT